MKLVYCPNPACRRGVVWTGTGRPSRPVGKCPDCGRTTRLERAPFPNDRQAAAADAYRLLNPLAVLACAAAPWLVATWRLKRIEAQEKDA